MKIFLSYKFTGVDLSELNEKISLITDLLRAQKHEVWNSLEQDQLYKDRALTNADIMRDAFANLDNSDALLAFIDSADKSEGMLVEIGYALGKNKKFILILKEGLNTVSLRQLADQVIEFNSFTELKTKLSGIK